MATIDDFGGTADPLNAPPLGGPSGWAAAVRDYITGLPAQIAAKVAKTGDTMSGELNLPSQSFGFAIGDKMSFYDRRLNLDNSYGIGVEPNFLYFKSPLSYRWYSGSNADEGASDIMELRAGGLTIPEGTAATDAATKGYVDAKGEYATYTPAVSGVTVSTNYARYARVGDMVHVFGRLVLSSATITTDVNVSLPLAANANQNQPRSILLQDVSTGARYLGGGFQSTSTLYLRSIGTNGVMGALTGGTNPFTWGVGDIISYDLVYETTAARGALAEGHTP